MQKLLMVFRKTASWPVFFTGTVFLICCIGLKAYNLAAICLIPFICSLIVFISNCLSCIKKGELQSPDARKAEEVQS